MGYPSTTSESRRLIKDFGTCLKFDGVNDQVTLGTDNPFSSNFYFSTWIKWSGDSGTYQHIFSKRDSYGASTMMFDLYLNTGTNLLSLDTNVGSKNFNYLFKKHIWTHLVWVHNVTSSLEQIYINGDRIYSQAITTLGTGTTALNTISSIESTPIEGFNGKIDESVIGQSAPTWAEVIAMYTKYEYPNKWTYLKYDEGSGSTATDSSGNSNNGTISGATYVTDKVMTTRSAVTNRFLIPTSSQKSLFTNGTNALITLPASFQPLTTGFSISFWTLSYLVSGTPRIMSFVGTNLGFQIYNSNGNFWVQLYDGSSAVVNTNAGKIRYGVWQHLCITFTPNNFKFYINTTNTVTDTACTFGAPAAQVITLGRISNSGSGWHKMNVCNFTFQNTTTPWTTTQISDLYWRNIIPPGATQWSMNNVATDQNGENALTLTGTSYSTDVPIGTRSSV